VKELSSQTKDLVSKLLLKKKSPLEEETPFSELNSSNNASESEQKIIASKPAFSVTT
jgi:hypothetical protein